MSNSFRLSRRSLLILPLAPVAVAATRAERHSFQHDHILGTSLDLHVSGASATQAEAAEAAVLATIERLRLVLSTYDPTSEISRVGVYGAGERSDDLRRVIELYRDWERRTSGALRLDAGGKISVDALGKAYILDAALAAARAALPSARGITLDIGGDVVTFGEQIPLGVADPSAAWDNGAPLTELSVSGGAVATSGSYARGNHIYGALPGQAATVIAGDAVTANALATALCSLDPRDGLALVDRTQGAEAMIVTPGGILARSAGFAKYERPTARPVMFAGWPNGYQVSIQLTLKTPEAGGGGFGGRGRGQAGPGGGGFGGGGFGGGGFGGRGFGDRTRRPFVAVWAEDSSGQVVKNIAVWASKPRWMPELRTWWDHNHGSNSLYQMSRATRAPGQYNLAWKGETDKGPVVPAGQYKIWVETNREHGNHYQDSAVIDCSGKPASVTMKDTPEFEGVRVDFGPASSDIA